MKLADKRTCLCSRCEKGFEALHDLARALAADVLLRVAQEEGEAERKRLLEVCNGMPTALRNYRLRIKEAVAKDELASLTAAGQLRWKDLPSVPELDQFHGTFAGLVDAIAALVTREGAERDADVAQWLAGVHTLQKDLTDFLEHLKRWAWQDARYKQHKELVGSSGGRRLLIVWDFKEKVPLHQKMREVQGDYWDNDTLSLLDVAVFDGTCWRYIDMMSADTAQDAEWMLSVPELLARKLKETYP